MSEEQPPPPPPQPEEAVPEAPAPAAQAGMNENTWAMMTHLAGLAGVIFPLVGNIVGPLIPWIMKKDEMPSIDKHGKEALNFQISFAIYNIAATVIAGILVIIVIGAILLPLVWAAWYILTIVFPIIAGLKANEGKDYEYPMTIRFLK